VAPKKYAYLGILPQSASIEKWIAKEHMLHGSFPTKRCGICNELRALIDEAASQEYERGAHDQWENG
jgi:hypothetical protein